jgi:hypothetical protein
LPFSVGEVNSVSIIVNLDDVFAEQLRQEALAQSLPPEELARRLVQDGLTQRAAERHWQEQNRRRLELIAKKSRSSLTSEEFDELGRLQEVASQRALPFDRELRRTTEELRREVSRLAESVQ